jgi:hypothetical protein
VTGPGDPDRDQDRERDLDRDRDSAGRARNARPRDGLGRPLGRDVVGEPTMPDDLVMPADDAVVLAQQLIDDGRPFHAHEVLEAAWKAAPLDQRDLWKGLAQIAVGLTHARRGNSHGAIALLRRGADAVGRFASAADGAASGAARPDVGGLAARVPDVGGPGGRGPGGVDAAAVSRAATQLADQIAADGLDSVPADDLLLRLRAPGGG